jgi:hypothetical protein
LADARSGGHFTMQNRALTEQESSWVNELAGRLRLIQADAASSSSDKRHEYLQEEIARRLKGVPPADRKHRLEALMARFPVAGKIGLALPSSPAPAAAPKKEETPEQILQRFIAAASALPEAQRTDLSKKLYEAGFKWAAHDAPVVEVSDELRQKFNLQPNQQPRAANVVQLVLYLVDVFDRLDQTALSAMREMAPKSQVLKRQPGFRNSAVRFLTGEQDGEQIEGHVRAVSALLGALLAATLSGGREFGKRFIERLSPNSIEDVIIGEGGKLWGPNKKERCWDRYKDLAGDYATPDLIDRRVKDSFATVVERTMSTGR